AETSPDGSTGAGGPMTREAPAPTWPATAAAGRAPPTRPPGGPASPPGKGGTPLQGPEAGRPTEAATPPPGPAQRPPWRTWPAAAAASLLGLIALGIIMMSMTTDRSRTRVTVNETPGDVAVDHQAGGGGPARPPTRPADIPTQALAAG